MMRTLQHFYPSIFGITPHTREWNYSISLVLKSNKIYFSISSMLVFFTLSLTRKRTSINSANQGSMDGTQLTIIIKGSCSCSNRRTRTSILACSKFQVQLKVKTYFSYSIDLTETIRNAHSEVSFQPNVNDNSEGNGNERINFNDPNINGQLIDSYGKSVGIRIGTTYHPI